MDFIFDPSLVLYLPLYELGGSSFKSRDAYGHVCTVTGAGWRPNGAYFDGTDDWVDCGDISAFDGVLSEKTVEIWINVTDVTNSQAVIGKYDSATSPKHRTFLVQVRTGGKLHCNVYADGDAGNYIIQETTNAALSNNTWHDVVGVFNLNPRNIDIFVDGVERASGETITGTPPLVFEDTSIPVDIGRLTNPASYFTGLIGEVRIYNRALSPLEIQHNYLATKWRYR